MEWLNQTTAGTLNSTIRLEAFLPPPSGMAAIPAPAFSPAGRAALTAAILGGAGWSFIGKRRRRAFFLDVGGPSQPSGRR